MGRSNVQYRHRDTCGGRLCIEANPNQGKGSEKWNGAVWAATVGGAPMVIPKGY